ncbi:(2Fe-2S) ferredoxin domain-containing protein [Sessilibacter corallicola]|uniref:(2Fe-2S) ferredoxin domain-containing protein n=1 Tax=Sessilibacter corallicola TaxID=2904075 RepID=UPI001E60D5CA|nr:(2Fe-2S) ferredoxin domain-containing protein [Sessilibacter corallicola]MCE2029637.1 (2Fe-2S) ferredoxin domain-containing protein [Sessilibacter corallicola]
MPKPDHHIFICAQNRQPGHPRGSCAQKGCADVFNAFSKILIQKNLQNVALTQTGCLGPCQTGSNVLIYPGGTMYGSVEAEDAEKIIDQHIIDGKLYSDKLAPEEFW